MATSSIFADFSIYDPEKAEAFVDALDKSAHDPKHEYKKVNLLRDSDEIKRLFDDNFWKEHERKGK